MPLPTVSSLGDQLLACHLRVRHHNRRETMRVGLPRGVQEGGLEGVCGEQGRYTSSTQDSYQSKLAYY